MSVYAAAARDQAPAPSAGETRWEDVCAEGDIVPGTGSHPAVSGALLVRPDGHVGFRATPADAAGLAALDAFLDSYLVPAPI